MQRLSSLDGSEEHQKSQELVGEEAALRLSAFEQEEQAFDDQVGGYIQDRQSLLDDPTLSDTERAEAIVALREAHFDASQRRRVEVLERIHDQNLSSTSLF